MSEDKELSSLKQLLQQLQTQLQDDKELRSENQQLKKELRKKTVEKSAIEDRFQIIGQKALQLLKELKTSSNSTLNKIAYFEEELLGELELVDD